MSRFNTKAAPKKVASVRVCLFVDPEKYRRLRALCVLEGTNVSRWFNEQAGTHLKHANR